jgi:hypothetical protein
MAHGREAHGQIGQIANVSKQIRQQQRHWCRPTKSETLQKRRTNEPPPASSTHARPKRACAIDCASYARVILLWPTAYNCASDATVRATSQQCRRRAGAAPCLPAALPRAWTSAGRPVPSPTARYQTGAGTCNFFGGVSSFRVSVSTEPHSRPLPPVQTRVPFPADRRFGTQKLLTPRKKVQIPRMVWYRLPLGRRRAAGIRAPIMRGLCQYDPRIIGVAKAREAAPPRRGFAADPRCPSGLPCTCERPVAGSPVHKYKAARPGTPSSWGFPGGRDLVLYL